MNINVSKNILRKRMKNKTASGSGLYHAQYGNNDSIWAEGRTKFEAIGKLIMISSPKGITVNYKL